MRRIHGGDSGKVLFAYNTAAAFDDTTSGMDGHGGSTDNATVVAAGDML